MKHYIIKIFVIGIFLVPVLLCPASCEEDGFALIKLQMQAVQKQGEATFALAAKNIDGAISANAEAASISRTVIQNWRRMAPDRQKQFGPTAETASSTILSSMKNMAYLYRQIQKYEEAESALNEAKAIAEERNDSIQKIECMKEAAELKWARKSYLAASLLYEKIVREQEPEIVKDPKWDLPASGTAPSQAGFMDQLTELNDAITKWGAYIQLASLYTYMCDLENSLRIFRLPGFIRLREWLQYRGNLSASFDESTPFGILNWAANLFPSYYHLGKGQVLNRLERYQDALAEVASASALLAGRPLPEAHFALANLKGFALQKLGKFDEAVTLYREGTSLTASMSPGIKEISECYSRLYLIDALLEKSEISEALHQIILAEEAGRKVNDPRQLWDIMFLKGKAKRMQGKLEEALVAFKESIENVEKFRATLSLERLKRDFMATKTKAYEEIVGVLLSLNKPAEAISYVERANARALVDLF